MDLELDASSEAFRLEVREWLAANLARAGHHVVRAADTETARDRILEAGRDAGVPDQPLNQWDYYVAAEPHITSVEDVRVEGDRASAVVTAVSAGQAETRTQRYLREDGRWKFCN